MKIELEYKEVWYLFKLNRIKFHVEHSYYYKYKWYPNS